MPGDHPQSQTDCLTSYSGGKSWTILQLAGNHKLFYSDRFKISFEQTDFFIFINLFSSKPTLFLFFFFNFISMLEGRLCSVLVSVLNGNTYSVIIRNINNKSRV